MNNTQIMDNNENVTNFNILPDKISTPLLNSKNSRPNTSQKQSQRYCIDIDVNEQLSRDTYGSNVFLDGDSTIFGDERITPAKLKKLLQMRPDITKLLSDCIIENGIEK